MSVPVSVSWTADSATSRSPEIAGNAGRYRSTVSGPNAVNAPSIRTNRTSVDFSVATDGTASLGFVRSVDTGREAAGAGALDGGRQHRKTFCSRWPRQKIIGSDGSSGQQVPDPSVGRVELGPQYRAPVWPRGHHVPSLVGLHLQAVDVEVEIGRASCRERAV